MKGSVDRLTVLDGVIIAVGWCEGSPPEIYSDSIRVDPQVCIRYPRPDVDKYLGTHGKEDYGYKITAVSQHPPGISNIQLRYSDGTVNEVAQPESGIRIAKTLADFIEMVNSAPDGASLLELGSRARSGNSYRSAFSSRTRYTGVDISDGPNVDVVADLHVLSSKLSEKFDFAFSVSVFEHLLMPWVAAVELNKVMADNGCAYIQSHPTWPLHDEPWDFFRFSKYAWKGIFNSYTGFEILAAEHGLEARILPLSDHCEALDKILPMCDHGEALVGLNEHPTFLASACLVRKISEPTVDWNCDPSNLVDLNYSH